MDEQAESAAAVSVAEELPNCEPDNEADSKRASDFADDGFFQWTKQWYPMAAVACLDPQKPHAMQLLGKNVVLWRDGTQTWRCFEDACPHRLAPLSEGRVEADGTLLCAYHAWRFDGEGRCDRIPQARDAATEAKHRHNPKSCAIAHPTQVRQGLIWVWGDVGAGAIEDSRQRAPRIISELDDTSGRVVKSSWNFRDLPYGWDFFIENVADPAHVPVTHHGIVGNRYTGAKYYDMLRLRETTTQDGFAFDIRPLPGNVAAARHDFQPPCLMRISTEFEDGGAFILILYATPTRPGWCRHIGQQILVKNSAGKVPKGLAFFALPMPTWLNHVLASLFLHQDMVFLHYQEKTVAQRKRQRQPTRWHDEVYTPNPQDKMIVAFRQWLEKRAGGGVPWHNNLTLPAATLSKQQLFDVWHTHTAQCQVCQKALTRINWVRRLAYGTAIVLFGLALMIDARAIASSGQTSAAMAFTLPPTGFWIAIFAAALSGAVGYGLQRLRQLFYFYAFEHSQND
ncbi:MAG: Rieske 2Fe-2S domain-containing protein [Cyanobacteria bacterium J06614_10]